MNSLRFFNRADFWWEFKKNVKLTYFHARSKINKHLFLSFFFWKKMEFFKNQPRTIILRNEFILFRDESKILVEIFLHCTSEGFVPSGIAPEAGISGWRAELSKTQKQNRDVYFLLILVWIACLKKSSTFSQE